MKAIQNKLSDQDFLQKISMIFIFAFELYRSVMGSFLLFFVPQRCGNEDCAFFQRVSEDESTLYRFTVSMNVLTFVLFFILYITEAKRENRLITYLHVNPNEPTDNESVGQALNRLDQTRKERIWSLDKHYQHIAYTTIYVFIPNSILSGYVIYNGYTDDKSLTVFITNVLFLLTKLIDVYTIAHTDKNVFLSAYMKKKVQFNDIDPDKAVAVQYLQNIESRGTSPV
jgi:hypothetical protein